jgi:hypothetical protein
MLHEWIISLGQSRNGLIVLVRNNLKLIFRLIVSGKRNSYPLDLKLREYENFHISFRYDIPRLCHPNYCDGFRKDPAAAKKGWREYAPRPGASGKGESESVDLSNS